jgi:glyoxylase-like metal-dependent hydrolase (beta-lactamase superfamily II)
VLPEGVHRLELPTPFAIGPVGCYVLRGDPLTLVDPGPLRDKTSAALDDGLRALGLRVEDAELVVITHQHHDHAGLAADVVRRSGARLATSPRLAAYLGAYEHAMDRDDTYSVAMMRRHGIDDDVRGTLDDISRSFRRYGEGAAVDVTVGDGEEIVAGGRTFTAFERPGHSPTDTVFVDAEGLLIGGDHLLPKVSSNPIAHVPIDDRDPVEVATRDRRRALVEYLASMRATAAMDVSVVLPGHGEPFADHRGLVASREEMHARRARRILRSVDGTRTAADLIAVLWRALPVTQHYLALSEVLGHLDLLEADGLVRAVERDDGVVMWSRPPKRSRAAA